MRKILIILFATMGLSAMAQKLTFHSAEFELGVKKHLGLSADADVIQSQADTITTIDLSGLGITDIRDAIYLPQVKEMNLSNNGIIDTFPLTVLDSLQLLNLCNNELESINPLVFSNAQKMQVLIAYNYINDFSFFLTPAKCQITLIGMGQQQEKDAPYFDVYQLYADVSDASVTRACYRGYTNMEANVTLRCGELNASALMDGYTNSVTLPYEIGATTQVILSNGEVGDTTYVVPPKVHIVQGGDEVTIDTELPESYQIGYLRALHGTVEADGAMLHYTAPFPIVADTLYMSYYEGNRIRGFAQMYFMSQDFYDGVKTLQQDSPIEMSLHDGVLNITAPQAQKDAMTAVKVYDAMGRTLATKRQEGGRDIVITLPKSSSVVIVEITCADRHIVTKVSAK